MLAIEKIIKKMVGDHNRPNNHSSGVGLLQVWLKRCSTIRKGEERRLNRSTPLLSHTHASQAKRDREGDQGKREARSRAYLVITVEP